jgi:hypothetical protein
MRLPLPIGFSEPTLMGFKLIGVIIEKGKWMKPVIVVQQKLPI